MQAGLWYYLYVTIIYVGYRGLSSASKSLGNPGTSAVTCLDRSSRRETLSYVSAAKLSHRLLTLQIPALLRQILRERYIYTYITGIGLACQVYLRFIMPLNGPFKNNNNETIPRALHGISLSPSSTTPYYLFPRLTTKKKKVVIYTGGVASRCNSPLAVVLQTMPTVSSAG